MPTKIYYNPRCSKCRQTLQLLRDKGVEPEVVEYLKDTPAKDELKDLLALLGLGPRDVIRTTEAIYKELGLADASLSDDALLDAMVAHPKLIQRPIVVRDGMAVLGRPPERVLEIL